MTAAGVMLAIVSTTSCIKGRTAGCEPHTAWSCGAWSYCNGATLSCSDCPLGRYNCDGVFDCESAVACEGEGGIDLGVTRDVGIAPRRCDPNAADACDSVDHFCTSAAVCQGCALDFRNCNGDNADGCEHHGVCLTPVCDRDVEASCGTSSSFCTERGQCEDCPTIASVTYFNCDGIGDCEHAGACEEPSLCLAVCQAVDEQACVMDSLGVCVECVQNEDCDGNPRALGPWCNAPDGLCYCRSESGDGDCVGHSAGSRCREGARGWYCGCGSSADCTEAPYTTCTDVVGAYGGLERICVKP